MRRGRNVESMLRAGVELMAERGVHGLTMRDVARRSGISLASLYAYVAGKDELVCKVLARVLEGALASAEAAGAARGPKERLRALATDHIRRMLERPFEARLLQDPLPALPDPLARRLQATRRQHLDVVRGILDGALGAAGARTASERRALLLLGMCERLALDAAGAATTPRPDRLAAPVLALFLENKGSATPRRRERRS